METQHDERRVRPEIVENYRDFEPPANFLQQQARFDKFIEVFNKERPHEALDMKCPADVYTASTRPYPVARASQDGANSRG
jgi:hypothetical protein